MAAQDNAKKYGEDGQHGGEGSDTRTRLPATRLAIPRMAGPTVNPMIKITNVALLLLAMLAWTKPLNGKFKPREFLLEGFSSGSV